LTQRERLEEQGVRVDVWHAECQENQEQNDSKREEIIRSCPFQEREEERDRQQFTKEATN
jgi:hypothetical protein